MASSMAANGATGHEPDTDKLSNLERLILVQAVYEFGNFAWPEVSKLLSSHPMLSHSQQQFTPAFCNAVYRKLMQDVGLECPTTPESSRKAIVHRQLAKLHYDRRVEEVRSLLLAEESKFRKIVGEIDDIRAGRWDRRILGEEPFEATEDEQPSVPEPEEAPEAEIITIDNDEPAVDIEQSVEEPRVAEPDGSDVEDGVAEKTDAEMQPVPADASAAPDDSPSSEEEATAKGYTLVEHTAPEPEPTDDTILEEATALPQTEAVSRELSPSVSIKEENIDQENSVEQDQPVEIIDEVVTQENAERPDESLPDAGEAPAPEVETKAEAEPEQEVEADADIEAEEEIEIEMVPASDDERSTRTDGKRKASEPLSESHRERKRAREDSEPVDEDEPGPSTSKGRRKAQAPDKKFQNVIGMLHSTISQHRYGNIFHNPIKKSEAPDYHDIVKRPMDLKTIKARVKDGLISNSLEFQRDIYLMFANAMMYNRPGSDVHNMAEEMMLESEIHINSFRQTEGFHRS